jgi:hypothetical protein
MNYPDANPVPGKPAPGIVVMAKPGKYQVRLTVDGQSQAESFELKINPNEKWTKADTDARFELWMKVREITDNANQSIIESREKVAVLKERGVDANMLKEIEEAQAAFESSLVPVGKTLVQIANEPAKPLPKLATVHHMLYSSEGRPPKSAYAVVAELSKEIDSLIAKWKQVEAKATGQK